MAAAPKPLRNWAAIDPLMRKGGAHQAPKKQTRPKLDWRDALDDFEDWQDEASGDNVTGDNEGAEAPFFLVALRLLHASRTKLHAEIQLAAPLWELACKRKGFDQGVLSEASFSKLNLPTRTGYRTRPIPTFLCFLLTRNALSYSRLCG